MSPSDILEFLTEVIPRPVWRVALVVLAFGLVVGFARPAFSAAVGWYIRTESHAVSSQLTPIVEQMLTAAAATPAPTTRP
ncbi:MAG TPA: hypothetical protein VGK17_24025 [Propionicimonas sp.]|jgi:hypothetical protein